MNIFVDPEIFKRGVALNIISSSKPPSKNEINSNLSQVVIGSTGDGLERALINSRKRKGDKL